MEKDRAVKGPQIFSGEFDPGSELTLAACLTHASRAGLLAVAIQSCAQRQTGE